MKTIYSLSLHEDLKINDELTVKRVPGGWHYIYSNGNIVNVDMNREFAPKEQVQKKISFSYEDRVSEFKEEVRQAAKEIGYTNNEILKEFFEYWSEKTVKGDKLKKEIEDTFSVRRRLNIWIKNDKKFKSQNENQCNLQSIPKA